MHWLKKSYLGNVLIVESDGGIHSHFLELRFFSSFAFYFTSLVLCISLDEDAGNVVTWLVGLFLFFFVSKAIEFYYARIQKKLSGVEGVPTGLPT